MRVNGKPILDITPQTLHNFLEKRGLHARSWIAVSLNGEIVPRSQWRLVMVQEKDDMEIVEAAAGG
jgi:thiamine biosynthesis protein ThiS